MVTKVLYTKIYRVLRTYGRVEKNAPQPSVLWGGYTVRWRLKPNLYALSKKTKSRIPLSIIHIFYQLKVRFKLDSMHLTIWKYLWPQITPRSELLGLKSYCALKICSLLVKKCPFLVPKIYFYKNSQKFLRW